MATHHHHGQDTHDRRRLLIAFLIIVAFMGLEFVGGLLFGSLALLADAGHMLIDGLALGIALVAATLARRPSTKTMTFGIGRVEVLGAFLNGILLVGMCTFLVIEAIERFHEPQDVNAEGLIVVAAIGLVVNIVMLMVLHGGNRQNLNMKAAFLHVIGDALGSVGALTGGLVILFWQWMLIDVIVSLVIACLIVFSALRLLRESTLILLEATPPGTDLDRLRDEIAKFPKVKDVHCVNVWSIRPQERHLSAHIVVDDPADFAKVQQGLIPLLRQQHGFSETTLQFEVTGQTCASMREAG